MFLRVTIPNFCHLYLPNGQVTSKTFRVQMYGGRKKSLGTAILVRSGHCQHKWDDDQNTSTAPELFRKLHRRDSPLQTCSDFK